MEFKVEYKYTKDWIPPRCRKPRPGTFDGETKLAVREIGASDAPWACVTSKFGRYNAIRHYDGRFYERALKDVLIETVRRSGTHCWTDHIRTHQKRGLTVDEMRGDITYFALREYKSEEQILDELHENAGKYLIIDGEVWHEIGEPRYEVVTFGLGHNHGGTSWFVNNIYNDNLSWRAYFNANDFERMVESFFDTALGRGDTNDAHLMACELADGSYKKHNYIEVIDPSVFKCDPRCEHGDGDPFMNMIYGMTQGTGSALESGLLVMASALREIG